MASFFGATVKFDLQLSNVSAVLQRKQVWGVITQPNGGKTGTFLENVALASGESLTKTNESDSSRHGAGRTVHLHR
jgi:hypothetical protein